MDESPVGPWASLQCGSMSSKPIGAGAGRSFKNAPLEFQYRGFVEGPVILLVRVRWLCLRRITARMCLLLLLCMVRGCYFCIEQPTNSCMYRTFSYVLFLQKVAQKLYKWTSINLRLGGFQCICCEVYMGLCGDNETCAFVASHLSAMAIFGHDFLKPTRCFGVWWVP